MKKKVSMQFCSEYEGELSCDDGSHKVVKRLGFFQLFWSKLIVLLGKVDVFEFEGPFGTLDDHINFEQPKKH